MQVTELFPNVLRSVVSIMMFALLLFTLAQPKYGKRMTYIAALWIFLVDVLTSVYFYRSGDFTALAKFDVALYILIGLVTKPLFRDTVMQWFFNFITAMNVFVSVMILSYVLCDYLPYPIYANTSLRFLMFTAVILLFRRFLRPVYRQAAERWNVFFFTAACIFLTFAYNILFSDDIEATMTEQFVPLLLLIVLSVAVYLCIFYSLQKISSEYALREENLKFQTQQELLHLSAIAMEQRLRLMDEAAQQSSIAAHDRRHFINTLLEFLRQGQTAEAIALLENQTKAQPAVLAKYCENTTVNAAVAYYARLAMQEDIELIVRLDIPAKLRVGSLELANVVSNLLENAVHACEKLPDDQKRYIRFTCLYTGQLILEVENPYDGKLQMDENVFPLAAESGHGIGTKSIYAFAQSQGAQVIYSTGCKIFCVRILI